MAIMRAPSVGIDKSDSGTNESKGGGTLKSLEAAGATLSRLGRLRRDRVRSRTGLSITVGTRSMPKKPGLSYWSHKHSADLTNLNL